MGVNFWDWVWFYFCIKVCLKRISLFCLNWLRRRRVMFSIIVRPFYATWLVLLLYLILNVLFPWLEKVHWLHLSIHKSISEEEFIEINISLMLRCLTDSFDFIFFNKQFLPSISSFGINRSGPSFPLGQLLKETSSNLEIWSSWIDKF